MGLYHEAAIVLRLNENENETARLHWAPEIRSVKPGLLNMMLAVLLVVVNCHVDRLLLDKRVTEIIGMSHGCLKV